MTTPLGARLVRDRWVGLAISLATSRDIVGTLGQPWTVKTDLNGRREVLSDVLSILSKDKAEEHVLLNALEPSGVVLETANRGSSATSYQKPISRRYRTRRYRRGTSRQYLNKSVYYGRLYGHDARAKTRIARMLTTGRCDSDLALRGR